MQSKVCKEIEVGTNPMNWHIWNPGTSHGNGTQEYALIKPQ